MPLYGCGYGVCPRRSSWFLCLAAQFVKHTCVYYLQKEKLSHSRAELAPLKESNKKLQLRINELNSSLVSREKKVSSLSQEFVELKTVKQHLEEEYTRQRKLLQQQMTKGSSNRTEIQRLSEKNKMLEQANAVS